MHIHFVVHESFEAPGAFETWAGLRGYTVAHSRVYLGDRLPQSVTEIDLLVVMGGPQSPATTPEECPHFDAAAERSLISKSIAAQKAVVGVCLGAQLIGEALGAKHEKSPEKEIGKFPIRLTHDGRANEKVKHFPEGLEVGHWHNDMPGLTPTSRILAFSEGCPRQIVEYADLAYGLQCHLEFTPDLIEGLIAHSETELAAHSDHRFMQQPPVLRAHQYDEMNEMLFHFLDKLMVLKRSADSFRTGSL